MKVSLINKAKLELENRNIDFESYCLYFNSIGRISDRDVLIIQERLKKTSFEDIGKMFCVSHVRIRNIESSLSKKLVHLKWIKVFQNAKYNNKQEVKDEK